jgi:hypothetical protein
MTGYAQSLRAIGQALEVIHVQDFDMEIAGGNFFIRASPPAAERELLAGQCSADQLRAIWGKMPPHSGESGVNREKEDPSMPSRIELCYTSGDIERLEEAGHARRENSHSVADAWSLSHVLRSIGGYLNQKNARPFKISREIDRLAVEYETSAGDMIKETLAVSELYEIWVSMYRQRAERAVH